MATNIGKYYKVWLVFVCVCVAAEVMGQPPRPLATPPLKGAELKGLAVLAVAKKDVGLIEGRSNTGFTQKYAKRWNEAHPKGKLALNSPYCGLAVWYWYRSAGVDPNISFSPRALNWKTYCQKPVSFFGLTIKDLEGIPPAAAVIYKNSWGNHVGLFEQAIMADIYTYEGNTSSARSVQKYSTKKEGVFYLKTSVNNKDLKPIFYCDCIKQSKPL